MSIGPYALFPRTPFLFSSLNVQKNMLQDRIRLSRFKEAIFHTVRPGDNVIDLGTGTGILAIWAAQAGASQVYAIEETDAASAACAVVRENGLSDIVHVLRANSQDVCLPCRADVLIAELVGHFIFEEGIVEYIADLREKLLKPSARIIPAAARAFIAPLHLGTAFEEITFWRSFKQVNLSAISRLAANSAYVESIGQASIIGDPQECFNVEFSKATAGLRDAKRVFRAKRNGQIDALGGWFEMTLSDGISLSTSPRGEPTHWKQCVFPLERPAVVHRGDLIDRRQIQYALPFAQQILRRLRAGAEAEHAIPTQPPGR